MTESTILAFSISLYVKLNRRVCLLNSFYACNMYVLNTSKSAVPIGENVLARNTVKMVVANSGAAIKSSQQPAPCCYPSLKWSAFPLHPYRVLFNLGMFEQTKNALLDVSSMSSIKSKLLASVTQVRSFVQSTRQDQMKSQDKSRSPKPLPRLLYIQNPLVWFSNKMDFRHLRVSLDPTFSEKEFTRGARQAVSRVTQLLSMSMFDSMKPLFTKAALLTLRRDVEILWSDEVRRNIALEPHDIQLIIPRKLHFRNFTDKCFCDIDVVFIGLKHVETGRQENSTLLFVDIISRFHRNYTEGALPDWTIAAFKVRKFNVIPTKTS